MRFERWYWLPLFCLISLGLHSAFVVATRGIGLTKPRIETNTIEVSLDPTPSPPVKKPENKPVPPKKPVPPPKPPPVRRIVRKLAPGPRLVSHEKATGNPTPLAPYKPRLIARVNTPPALVKPKVNTIPELPRQLQDEAPTDPLKVNRVKSTAPHLRKTSSNPDLAEGGGSASPSPNPTGGTGGYKAPEAPKEDVLYTGGGRGGLNLPAAAPSIGGGGGQEILSVKGPNLLGDGVPDERPGIGPGNGGGIGNGSGGGAGFRKGQGVGTSLDGKVALGSLRRKPGAGIGAAAEGNRIGTKPPGGGRNTGADLPGTGGTGNGYGRGHANGIGDGTDDEPHPTRMRGVPFGNIAGILGSPDGGRGTQPGRGAVFVSRAGNGGGGPVHIVYALDISGSMRDGDKIAKAQEALIQALRELHPVDRFNIITFKRTASTFKEDLVPATPTNILNAISFVQEIRIGDGTNISAAMDLALNMSDISHIYLMSDGEPNGGIMDFNQLRQFIKDKNTGKVKILTLALGLGEDFPGMRLLHSIADDNNGVYHYVPMQKIKR